MKKEWYKLTQKEIKELIAKRVSSKRVLATYKEPDWCSLPLESGCMSLILGSVKSERFCKKCDCYCSGTKVRSTTRA